MNANDNSQLVQAKKKLNNSIIITGIYTVTAVSYNLVRQTPANTNIIFNAIDILFTESLALILGASIFVTNVICNVIEYNKVKRETVKTIGSKK